MSGSLGSLYVSLEAKLGSFVDGMTKAQHVSKTQMRKIQQNADQMSASLRRSFSGVADTIAAAFAVREVAHFTGALVETQIAAQRIRYTMQQAFGADAGAQIRFVTNLSQQLGLSLQTSEQAFAELGASAQGTKVTAADLQTLFKGMAESSTVLHTSDADVAGVYTQLSQGISLGKLHMQDIRAIAQHLPGTMVILTRAAKDMGTTLSDALAHGGLDAATALKYIGIELHKTFGAQAIAASHSLNAELNRLHSTFFSLQAGSKGLEESFAGAIRSINDALQDPKTIEAIQTLLIEFGKGIAGLAEAAARAVPYIKSLMDNIGAIAVFFGTRLIAVRILGFFASITTGAGLATGAMTVMRGVLGALGGPIGLAALAIGGLTVGFMKLHKALGINADLQKYTDLANGVHDATQKEISITDQLATSYGKAAEKLRGLVALQQGQANYQSWQADSQVAQATAQLENAKSQLKSAQDALAAANGSKTYSGTAGEIGNGQAAAAQMEVTQWKKAVDEYQDALTTALGAQRQSQALQAQLAKDAATAKQHAGMKGPSSGNGFNSALGATNPAVLKAASAYEKLVRQVDNLIVRNGTLAEKETAQTIKLADQGAAAIKAGADQTKVQAEVVKGMAAITTAYQRQIDVQNLQEQQYVAGMKTQSDVQQKAFELSMQSVNMTQDQIEAQSKLNAVVDQYNQKLQDINNQIAIAKKNGDTDQVNTLQKRYNATENQFGVDYNRQVSNNTRTLALKQSPIAGMKEGMLEFAQTGLDVADQMKTAFSNLFSGLSDAIVQWAETGKLNFKDVLKSFLEMVLKMEIQALAAKVILSFLGVGGVFGGSASGLANTNLNGTATFNSLTGAGHYYGQAKGGAWWNGLQKFASGSVFANHVVSSPTLFRFAGGTGVMGEAGPEAIMPLSRGKNGKLGIQVSGNNTASGNNPAPVTVNVINNSNSQAQVQHSTNPDGSKIIDVIIGEINNQIARGGSTYKTISQTFGLRRQGIPV